MIARWLRRLIPGRTSPTPISREAYIASPPPIADELLTLFTPGDNLVIFDIGACEGEDAVRYARLFPTARVIAVEPLPANVALARATIDRYAPGRVTLLPCALSDRSGSVEMHVSSGQPPEAAPGQDWDYGNKSSSLLPPGPAIGVHPWLRFEATIAVEARTLAEVCGELALDRVDFLHIDVQGAELMVLEGAGRILETVRAIWLEVEAIPLYEGQPLKHDVEDYLLAHGFQRRLDTVDRMSGDQFWVRGAQQATETA